MLTLRFFLRVLSPTFSARETGPYCVDSIDSKRIPGITYLVRCRAQRRSGPRKRRRPSALLLPASRPRRRESRPPMPLHSFPTDWRRSCRSIYLAATVRRSEVSLVAHYIQGARYNLKLGTIVTTAAWTALLLLRLRFMVLALCLLFALELLLSSDAIIRANDKLERN